MGAQEIATRKPTAQELEARFLQFLSDPRFSDVGPWELNDHGDIVVSPVSGEHGRAQAMLCAELERQLGGRAWIEQAVRRAEGAPLVPDVLWSDIAFFDRNKAAGLLPAPPRLCVEVVSPSNAIDRLRRKCAIYVELGAEEAWLMEPVAKLVEVYGNAGRRDRTGLAFDFAMFWAKL